MVVENGSNDNGAAITGGLYSRLNTRYVLLSRSIVEESMLRARSNRGDVTISLLGSLVLFNGGRGDVVVLRNVLGSI